MGVEKADRGAQERTSKSRGGACAEFVQMQAVTHERGELATPKKWELRRQTDKKKLHKGGQH
jgi:hypothetical protein